MSERKATAYALLLFALGYLLGLASYDEIARWFA